MIPIRLIRYGDGPASLGMPRNRFHDEGFSTLSEGPIGRRRVARDRHEPDLRTGAHVASSARELGQEVSIGKATVGIEGAVI